MQILAGTLRKQLCVSVEQFYFTRINLMHFARHVSTLSLYHDHLIKLVLASAYTNYSTTVTKSI